MADLQTQIAELQRQVAELKASSGGEPLTPLGAKKDDQDDPNLEQNLEDLKLPDSIIFKYIAPLTFAGVVLGYLIGMGLRDDKRGTDDENKAKRDILFFLKLPGKMFTYFLFCTVGPLIFTVMLTTPAKMAGLGGGVGTFAVVWYASTTLYTSLIYMSSLWFQILKGTVPSILDTLGGTGTEVEGNGTYLWAEHLTNNISNLIPKNFVYAMANMKMLGIIGFSLVWGTFLKKVSGGPRLLRLIDTGANSLLVCVINVMTLQPFCVCSLLINVGASKAFAGKSLAVLMAKYVSLGIMMMVIHFFGFYPLMFFILTKGKNPFRYMSYIAPAGIVALGTASSAATLPTTISCSIKAGVPPSLAKAVCSIGATVNMDGAVIWRMWDVLVITQSIGQPMNYGTMLSLGFVTSLMSCGAAPVPAAGYGSLMVLLLSTGTFIDDNAMALMGVMLGLFWALDRACTATNITGDAIGVGILAHRRGLMGKAGGEATDAAAETVAL